MTEDRHTTYRISEAARELGISIEWPRCKNTCTISLRVGGRAIVGRAFSGGHRTDPSPETSAREARARAWLYVFECYERKKAIAGSTARSRNEAKEENDVCGEIGTQG